MNPTHIFVLILCATFVKGKSIDKELILDNEGLIDFDVKIEYKDNEMKVYLETGPSEEVPIDVDDEEDAYYYGNYLTPGLSVLVDEEAPGSWNYNDEHGWDKHFPACGGIRQSPIDIDASEVQILKKSKCLKWTNYKNNQRYLTLKNPGHTIEASCTWESNELPILQGGILKSSYKFAALHWHWGAERDVGSDHTINGKASPLEMHLVHYNTKFGSLAEAIASHDSEALTVVGIMFEQRPTANLGMHLLVNSMLQVITNGTQNNILPLGNLGLNFDAGYYTYLGSLTTPPCTEIVRWIVLKEKLHISSAELQVFRNVLVNDNQLYNNFRHVQPLNGRIVTDISKCEH